MTSKSNAVCVKCPKMHTRAYLSMSALDHYNYRQEDQVCTCRKFVNVIIYPNGTITLWKLC